MMACQLERASTDSTGLGHDHVIIQDHAAGHVFGEGGKCQTIKRHQKLCCAGSVRALWTWGWPDVGKQHQLFCD